MCEKCLYKKNCQFLAKHKPSSAMVGCTAFEKDIDVLTKEIKTEVAREIFKEIERFIGEKYELYVFDNRDIEGVKQDAIIAFADTMKRHFAELKKKYTEEKI